MKTEIDYKYPPDKYLYLTPPAAPPTADDFMLIPTCKGKVASVAEAYIEQTSRLDACNRNIENINLWIYKNNDDN